jgi:hypothetical protein
MMAMIEPAFQHHSCGSRGFFDFFGFRDIKPKWFLTQDMFPIFNRSKRSWKMKMRGRTNYYGIYIIPLNRFIPSSGSFTLKLISKHLCPLKMPRSY